MKTANDNPRILFLDIETRPMIVHAWGMRDVNVSLNQVVEVGSTICVGAMWAGERKCQFFSDWQHGHRGMLEAIHAMWCEADAVVTYNGDKFDIKKLRGEFCKEGLSAPPPITSIDVYRTVRSQFGFDSNKLQHVADLLGLGSKLQHEGHGLWMKVMAGDPKARATMERYCCQDVKLLEKVYRRLLPYIPNHPHMGLTGSTACGACGSDHLQSRGIRRTKASVIQRLQCIKCGSWQKGKTFKAA